MDRRAAPPASPAERRGLQQVIAPVEAIAACQRGMPQIGGALVHIGVEVEQQPNHLDTAVIDGKGNQPTVSPVDLASTPASAIINSWTRGASAKATAARMVSSAPCSSRSRATAGNRSAPLRR
jgi:hypothetical protein